MNNNINFIKMHGLGNDFVLIDNRENDYKWKDKIQILTDRRIGIGCDQIIVLEQASSKLVDVTMKIINFDGSYAKACGNAMRCVARYLFDRNYSKSDQIILATEAGNLSVGREKQSDLSNSFQKENNRKASLYYTKAMGTVYTFDDYVYTAQLSKPNFNWQEIPISKEIKYDSVDICSLLKLDLPFKVEHMPCVVNTGNPHLVFFLQDKEFFQNIILDKLSANKAKDVLLDCFTRIQSSDLFPDSVNISLAYIRNSSEIDLIVYERGVGFTLACGSAASAVCVVGSKIGIVNNQLYVNFQLGTLLVKFTDDILTITGTAEYVFEGSV